MKVHFSLILVNLKIGLCKVYVHVRTEVISVAFGTTDDAVVYQTGRSIGDC